MAAETLESAQYFIFITQLNFCALYTVVAWDWLTSLPREWRFVWKSSWTPVKISYLFCRYWVLAVGWFLLYCFINDHSLETCQRIYKLPVALALWNQLGAEVILLIRTYAFFNRNKYVLFCLIASLMGVVAYQLYVASSQMLLLPFVKAPYTHGPCLPMSKPHAAHLLGFFLAPLAYDTIVTTMTVGKALLIRRRRGGIVSGSSSMLVQTFIREGVFYYILISMANLVNGIFYLQPRQSMSAICIPLSVFLSPVLACRLILDLREQGAETISRQDYPGVTPNSSSPPRFVNPSTSMTSSGSFSPRSPRSPISNVGIGFMPAKSNGRNKGQLVVSSKSVRGVTTTISMGTGTMEGVELEDLSKEDEEYREEDYKLDVGGVGGIRVDVEKTTSSM